MPKKNEITILIGNEGEAIPVELRDEIFRPGFTTKGGGRGTGLSLACRLMDSIDGVVALLPSDEVGERGWNNETIFQLTFVPQEIYEDSY